MDLTNLKDKFKPKDPLYIKILLFLTLIAVFVSIILMIFDDAEFWLSVFYALVLVLFGVVLLWGFKYGRHHERLRLAQIQHIYAYYANRHDMKTHRHYESIDVNQIKTDFNNFPLFKRKSEIRFQLHLLNPEKQTRLYFVSYGISREKNDAGYLFSYPQSYEVSPHQIIGLMNKQKYQRPFYAYVYQNNNYIFYSPKRFNLSGTVPIFITYKEKERSKVNNFADQTFSFFDDMNDQLKP